jgi:hypothetical protein
MKFKNKEEFKEYLDNSIGQEKEEEDLEYILKYVISNNIYFINNPYFKKFNTLYNQIVIYYIDYVYRIFLNYFDKIIILSNPKEVMRIDFIYWMVQKSNKNIYKYPFCLYQVLDILDEN